MPAWKAPPAIVQGMMISFGAHIYRDQTVLRRIISRLATSNEVGSGSADGILDNVRQKRRQNQTDSKTEDGGV